MNQVKSWDYQTDVLIVGSGNGAMTAALASHELASADVMVIEKSDKFGGTSALSGGGVWIPNNRYAKAAGMQDSYEEAYTYLKNTIPAKEFRPEMIQAYLKAGPQMVDFLYDHSRLRYQSLEKYPDYYSDLDGAKNGHRSMEPEPVNISELGDDFSRFLTGGTMYIFYKFAITQVEGQVAISRLEGWVKQMLKLMFNYYTDFSWLMRRTGFSRRTTGGGAGVIRLFLSLKDRNIPVHTETSLQSLIMDNGKVIGAVVNQRGKMLRVQAKKGVILAAGGFEQNQAMREQYLPKPTNAKWSAGCKTNTGDAIRIAQDAGAQLGMMDGAWWCTTKVIPDRLYPFLGIISKSLPGSIVVNKAGLRFSNESQNYMAFLQETFNKHTEENPCVPMYMVFDSHFRRTRNVWPAALPNFMLAKSYFDEGFMAIGKTPEELAGKLGINPENLRSTIERFNGFVDTGIDEDFKRGSAAYDRYYGDPSYKPNPCLGKIEKRPFIAIRLDAGDFGTQGGMVTNEHAQVLNADNQPIAGLYACGNCSMAVLPTYPGPGSTLGPAMTFGYLAGQHIAKQQPTAPNLDAK